LARDPAETPPAETTAPVRWPDLRARLISAGVIVPVAWVCLWYGGWIWRVWVGIGAVGLLAEWLRLSRRQSGSMTWAGALTQAAGFVYVLPAAAAVLWLRNDAAVGWANVLFVLLTVSLTDVGAYLFGRLIGGAKLAPSISPGKTWSGAAGGLAVALVVGLVAAGLTDSPLWRGPAVAAGLSVASQAGDLLESAIKRHFGVKDSGGLIPGHGGLFDRLDGLLMAAPVAALLAVALGRGVELWR
jgi:phosphatidate cytidylyltransferase